MARPIFFLHIPKTGGSTVNATFQQVFGVHACNCHFEDRAEYSLSAAIKNGTRFLSSHIALTDAKQVLNGNNDVLTFTVLRNPIRQTASHIQWVDFFNEEENQQNLQYLPLEIRDEVSRLKQVDFDCPSSLTSYLTSLSPVGTELFDNCQSRYLFHAKGRILKNE